MTTVKLGGCFLQKTFRQTGDIPRCRAVNLIWRKHVLNIEEIGSANPKNPDLSQFLLGLMVQKSHLQVIGLVVGEIPDS